MKTINSLKELNEEKLRITQRINDLEVLIEADVNGIKQDINAWRAAGTTIKNFLVTEENGVMGESIGLAVDTLVKKLLLRRSNWVFKFVMSFLLKNVAKNYFSKNAENIIEKIKNMVGHYIQKEPVAN
jgi:hypothetical protein